MSKRIIIWTHPNAKDNGIYAKKTGKNEVTLYSYLTTKSRIEKMTFHEFLVRRNQMMKS